MKTHDVAVLREHAVDDERVDVEIQHPTKPLDDGHRTTATICNAITARAAPHESEHSANIHRDDRDRPH